MAAWRSRVLAYRAEWGGDGAALWSRLAAGYGPWPSAEAVALTQLWCLDRVAGSDTVLEVGPGTGDVTVALARAVERVVVLEPATGMRDALQERLTTRGITNVTALPWRVEEALDRPVPPFDVAVAVHSLFDVEPLGDVLEWLRRCARRSLIVMGSGRRRSGADALRAHLGLRPSVGPAHAGLFAAVLGELGVGVSAEELEVPIADAYRDEDALVEAWSRRLGLGPHRHAELRTALDGLVEHRGGCVGFFGHASIVAFDIAGIRERAS